MSAGESNKPLPFENMDLSVYTIAGKHLIGWQKKDFSKNYFEECFETELREWLKYHNFPQKTLLLLDYALGHSADKELRTGW